MLPPDVLQPDVVVHHRGQLKHQIAAEKVHQVADFGFGTLPVFGGEGIQSQGRDVDACCGFDGRTYGRHARPVPGNARQMAAFGPSAITVHDDGYVMWKPLRIEAGEDLSLFAVQPGGNCRAQSETPCKLLKITQDSRSCNEALEGWGRG